MRLLLAHADLRARGGAEAYADAIADWLARAGHQVDRIDIAGHRTASGEISDSLLLRIGRLPGFRRLGLMKHALVCRALPRLSRRYDAAILTYGEGPVLPCRTLTVRHAPSLFSSDIVHLEALGSDRIATRALRRAYIGVARRIAGVRLSRATGPTLANSFWTAAEAKRTSKGVEPVILYPPCRTPKDTTQNRDPARVIALGRMVANKRLGDAIAVCNALRARGLPVRLDIAGRAEGAYARRLIRRFGDLDHVKFHPDATPEQVADLLGRARFGLHFFRNEHFGIAVAEMILAGVVPLVHDGGGVRELVTRRELRFANADDATERLAKLICAPVDQTDAIARSLREGPALAAAQDFEAHLEAALKSFLETA